MTDKSKRSLLFAALAQASSSTLAAEKSRDEVFMSCPRARDGANARRFPRVIVQDQYRERYWFYEELIAQRLVVVSFTSVKGEKILPIVGRLITIHGELKKRLKADVPMYTITTDPYSDDSDSLRALAERHGARWRFLTGKPEAIKEVLASFNTRGRLNALLWVGNEATGRWLNKPVSLPALFIAEAVARLSTGADHRPFMVDMRSVDV